jgi:phosphoribosylformimino-5-aminoimidazole carboxamide ribotide isomerase
VVPVEWPFENMVGVIDLLGGKAVHAIAGQRAKYKPVSFCDGDAGKLLQYYHRLGIRSFYIADLDSIGGGQLQAGLLQELGSQVDGDLLVDPGWSGSESYEVLEVIGELVDENSGCGVIAATETLRSPLMLNRLVERLAAEKVWLGLDFRAGELRVSQQFVDQVKSGPVGAYANGNSDAAVDPHVWVTHATQLGINGLVILDIAAVGQSGGPVTGEVCRQIRDANPEVSLWSGGGIRDAADARRLMRQGCDGCLVATALHHRN